MLAQLKTVGPTEQTCKGTPTIVFIEYSEDITHLCFCLKGGVRTWALGLCTVRVENLRGVRVQGSKRLFERFCNSEFCVSLTTAKWCCGSLTAALKRGGWWSMMINRETGGPYWCLNSTVGSPLSLRGTSDIPPLRLFLRCKSIYPLGLIQHPKSSCMTLGDQWPVDDQWPVTGHQVLDNIA